jgi:GNAT superfamily N-acetyltransferase
VFRLTPFSVPPALDGTLAQRGYVVFEPSLVQITRLSGPMPSPPDGLRFESMLLERWVEEAGAMRGLPPERRTAEFDRLHNGEAPGYCTMAYVEDEAVACGLVIHEEEFAGLFDVFVTPEQRGRGIGTAVSAQLLRTAQRMGARIGWLSVLADNAPALAAYAHLGFETLYEYWYRVRPGDA